ncbi:MAG: hypothetical protein ISR98_01005 [Parcubacteria group bacterium]|nr:hypothetical protein [Parcubacteria group bacterium]
MISEEIKTQNTQYDKIKIIIINFLEKLAVEFDEIEILENESYPIILINTKDSGILIGNNGEGLRAINYIIKRIIDKKLPQDTPQFLIDINGYNKQKIEKLKDEALVLAGRAKAFKSDVEMSPMNAYERMIIHSLFVDDNEIKTESKGEGKTRRIIFKYNANSKQLSNKVL